MKLEIRRFEFDEFYTIGKLSIDGIFFCYTLEDCVRDEKIPTKTAIPEGTYKVVNDWSPRFQRTLPHILNVPNFEGIRIHPGNCAANTDGCILVGYSYVRKGWLGDSREAMTDLMLKLIKETEYEITINSSLTTEDA